MSASESFGKQRTAEADARAEERRADPAVETDPLRDRRYVGPGRLADVRDLVDERDARHERGVRSQLHHLRGRDVAAHERRLDTVVERCDHVAVARLEGADDDAVGMHEVLHGGALGRELRIGHVPDVLEATIIEPMTNSASGSDRDGALHRDDDAVLDLR